MLEGLDYVERYAWFAVPQSSAKPATNLLDVHGNITAFGDAYKAIWTILRSGMFQKNGGCFAAYEGVYIIYIGWQMCTVLLLQKMLYWNMIRFYTPDSIRVVAMLHCCSAKKLQTQQREMFT
jgi:hypothetical protein